MKRLLLDVFVVASSIVAAAATDGVRPVPTAAVSISSLWEAPTDLASRDLFNGPWGAGRAPDPHGVYTLLHRKHHGVNPGVIVQDSSGRKWHVKQASYDGIGAEGPVEVAISRVLSGVGYHQPPVYYLPSFAMIDAGGRLRREPGGRFRLDEPSLRERGTWSWHRNPFIGTQPFDGLLVILLMFNSWDLKDSNNALYEVVDRPGRLESWYVVRDLGGALGESGHLRPKRNDIGKFERQRFATGVFDGFVEFGYRGKQPELVRGRMTVADVHWTSDLLGRLSDDQWRDAFRAGGYSPGDTDRFVRKIRANIALGRQISTGSPRSAEGRW